MTITNTKVSKQYYVAVAALLGIFGITVSDNDLLTTVSTILTIASPLIQMVLSYLHGDITMLGVRKINRDK